MQAPMMLKMSATWENEKSSSSIVPRICNLSITQVLFDRIVEEKLENNQYFFVTVRMRDNSRRVLRSPELAFPSQIPGIVNLNFNCSIQYSHALKRDSSNLLQLLIQRRKKYKKKSVNFGYKTLAYCTIDLAQVLQRKIENKMLDLCEDPKSFSNIVGRIEVQSLTSTPAEKTNLSERRKEFYEEDVEGIPDQFSEPEDSDHGEDSDFDPNCTEFGESRQKKIMKAMAVGVNSTSSHRRSSSPSAALPEWQKQIKQKIMGLLKKVKLMEHNEVPDPRDQWWDEIDQFENISEDSDLGELDSLSIQSTPRPVLKPFFGRNTNDGSNDHGSSEDTLNKDGAAKLFKKLQLGMNGTGVESGPYGGDRPIDYGLDEENIGPMSFGANAIQTSQPITTITQLPTTNVATTNSGTGAAAGGGGGGSRSFSLIKKHHSTHVTESTPTTLNNAITSSNDTQTSHEIKSMFTSSKHKTTTSVANSNPTSCIPTTSTSSGPLSLPSHHTNQNLSLQPTQSQIPTQSTTQVQQKQKKIPPISGIMKTFSLSSSQQQTTATNGDSHASDHHHHHHPPIITTSNVNSITGTIASVSGSNVGCLAPPICSTSITPSSSSNMIVTSHSNEVGLSSPTGHASPFGFPDIYDSHPRQDLVEQTQEFLNTLGDDPNSVNIIYLISLSDLGGKYVSDLFKKEYTPHLNLASYADTKYAFTQITNKIQKRTKILKVCLLGGDCHLNNVLRAFIDQINENYSTDVLSHFRFFIIPIIGLYLASNYCFAPTSTPKSVPNIAATSNIMARRLCQLDSKYSHLFSEFLQQDTPTISTDSGSERDNKFLFGVHDYLQAGSNVLHCPIGECLVSTKDKHQSITQDLESSNNNESFIPFIAEVRLGSELSSIPVVSTEASVTVPVTVSSTMIGGTSIAGQSNSAHLNRMDSSTTEEQFITPVTINPTINANSPPRSPVITVSSGLETNSITQAKDIPSYHHFHHHIHHHHNSPPSTLSPLNSPSNTATSLNTGGTFSVTNINTTICTNTAPTIISQSTALNTSLNTSTPQSAHEMQLEYWTDSSSKKLNIKAPMRQVLVHTMLSTQQFLSLTILTKEKKQKIMRIAKKTKHETGDTKKETINSVERIFCTAKGQNSEINLRIDGVVWSNVTFFQLSPSWRTNIKTFPIATFS